MVITLILSDNLNSMALRTKKHKALKAPQIPQETVHKDVELVELVVKNMSEITKKVAAAQTVPTIPPLPKTPAMEVTIDHATVHVDPSQIDVPWDSPPDMYTIWTCCWPDIAKCVTQAFLSQDISVKSDAPAQNALQDHCRTDANGRCNGHCIWQHTSMPGEGAKIGWDMGFLNHETGFNPFADFIDFREKEPAPVVSWKGADAFVGMPALVIAREEEKSCGLRAMVAASNLGLQVLHEPGITLGQLGEDTAELARSLNMSFAALRSTIDYLLKKGDNINAGRALAHARIWQKIVTMNVKHALILEQDMGKWGMTSDDLAALFHSRPLDGQVFQYATRDGHRDNQASCCDPGKVRACSKWVPAKDSGAPGNFRAYVVTQSGAQALLDHLSQNLLRASVDMMWQIGIEVKEFISSYHLDSQCAVVSKDDKC